MARYALMCALLVFGCELVMTGQKKPAQKPEAQPATAQHNREIARRVFEDLWSHGRADLVDSMFEPNAVVHWDNRNIPLQEHVSWGKEMRSAFPDLVVKVNRVTSNGDIVEVNWSATGTNRGHAAGYPGKGKPAKTPGASKFRFDKEGKIAEAWVDWDEKDLRKQVADK